MSIIQDQPVVQTSTEAKVFRKEKRVSRAKSNPFRTVWRWHFFAGVIITPFLVIIAATGAIFIFAAEIEQTLRSHLIFIEPGTTTVSPRNLVEAALAARPGLAASSLSLGSEANRSAIVGFGIGEQTVRVFVNPYTGQVLGSLDDSVDPVVSFLRGTLKFHRQLFLGTTGRVLVELSTGWTVVLLVSGLYLWWPRSKKAMGTWTIRWTKAKPYVRLRDLHSVFGAYLMPVALVIAITGHFYTLAWGTGARYAMGAAPKSAGTKKTAKPASNAKTTEMTPTVISLPPGLDQVVASARTLYPDRTLRVTLGTPPTRGPIEGPSGVPVLAINRFDSGAYGPIRAAQLVCSPADGSVLSNRSMAEKTDRWVQSWAYPLHVGSIAGMASKLVWLMACLILIALPITGLWMWWERRPKGRIGIPRKPNVGPPLWMALIVTGMSLFYPMVGVSALLFSLGELLWFWTIDRRRSGDRPSLDVGSV